MREHGGTFLSRSGLGAAVLVGAGCAVMLMVVLAVVRKRPGPDEPGLDGEFSSSGRGEEGIGPANADLDGSLPSGRIIVCVRFTGLGKPVAGAHVTLRSQRGWSARGRSSLGGDCRFAAVPAGECTVEVDADGLLSEGSRHVDVLQGCASLVPFELCAPVTFRGRVLASESGEPISGAIVDVLGPAERSSAQAGYEPIEVRLPGVLGHALTGADGSFSASVPVFGSRNLILRLASSGRRTIWRWVDAGDFDDEPVISLPPGGRIRGVVRESTGVGADGALVLVFPELLLDFAAAPPANGLLYDFGGQAEVLASIRARCAPDGSFEVTGVPVGEKLAALVLAANSSAHLESGIQVGPEGVLDDLSVDLVRGGMIRVTVRRPDGSPLAGYELGAFSESWGLSYKATTSAAGAACLGPFGPGLVEVSGEKGGWQPCRGGGELPEAGDLDLAFTPAPVPRPPRPGPTGSESVFGTIRDPWGRPITIGSVTLAELGRKTAIEPNGEFLIERIPEGQYDILVACDFGDTVTLAITGRATDVSVGLGSGVRGVVRLGKAAKSGEPVVVVRFGQSWASFRPEFGGQGLLRFWIPMESGPGRVTIMATGFLPIRKSVTVPDAGGLDLGEIELDPGLPAEGTVVDVGGAPVAGARVELDAAERGMAVLNTTATGRFSMGGFAPGTIRALVEAEGFLPYRGSISAGETDARIRLERGSAVSVALRTPGGVPVPRVPVELRRGEQAVAFGITDSAGRTLLRVAPGDYLMCIGWAEVLDTVVPGAGEDPASTSGGPRTVNAAGDKEFDVEWEE